MPINMVASLSFILIKRLIQFLYTNLSSFVTKCVTNCYITLYFHQDCHRCGGVLTKIHAVDDDPRKRLVYFAIFEIRVVCLNWSRAHDGKVVPLPIGVHSLTSMLLILSGCEQLLFNNFFK